MITRRHQHRSIQARGFHNGVHAMPGEPATGALQAYFQRAAVQVQHDAIDPLKGLEAREAILARRFRDAERHWRRLEEMTDGMAPEIATPLLATAVATGAAIVEVVLLAPVMDAFGISNPAAQIVTAAGLVVAASGLIHLTVRQMSTDSQAQTEETAPQSPTTQLHRPSVALVMLFTVALIVVLGWWRGAEMRFAATIEQTEWAQFLAHNGMLTQICVTLLTVGLPFFTAVALHWGLSRLRFGWEWRRAKQLYESLLRRLENTRKRHEALTEKRDTRVLMLEKQSCELQQVYVEQHELGQRIGAKRAPLWRPVLRIVAVAALVCVACVLIDPWIAEYLGPRRSLLYACVVVGIVGLYAAHALRAWDRPTPTELYRQRAVVWRRAAVIQTVENEHGGHELQPIEAEVVPDATSSQLRDRRGVMKASALIIAAAMAAASCSTQASSGRHVVYLVDSSASVTAEARARAVESFEGALQSLQRGDKVAVVPITGDVHGETLGRVLRFELSTRREPYDADRRRLVRDIHERLPDFLASVSPSTRTDLLGTLRLAAEELQSAPVRVLVCLTDFVQDDAQFDFNTDRRLASERSAKAFASELGDGFVERFAGVHVYLGSMESTDLTSLSKSRRAAIQAFWVTYFEAQGANVQWATDGPGHLPEFVKSLSTD